MNNEEASNTFVEKDIYSEPPNLNDTATKEEIREAWANWILSETRSRAAHKASWTKSQKHCPLPNFDTADIMMKSGGVWRQNNGMTGLIGNSELGSLEAVLITNADQDNSVSFRGKRSGRNKSGTKKSKSKKEEKRQKILRGK